MGSFSMKTKSTLQTDGRRVLQPAGNRVLISAKETGRPMKKMNELKITEEMDIKSKTHNEIDDPRVLESISEKPVSKVVSPKKKGSQIKKRDPVKISSVDSPSGNDEKRCSFIAPNSDPVCIAYHDEEWGVPVHDDRVLFELMVMAGAQVGLDWTTILKKRQDFRLAFSGFDAEVVAKFTEKQMAEISSEFCMDLSRVRSVVDNASCILQVRKEFGSLDEYFWRFVNRTPIQTQYKSCRKIPVKTSKSEAISKDMIRRGFRISGSAVILSFMQAAGLTNDHLLSCPRRQLQ